MRTLARTALGFAGLTVVWSLCAEAAPRQSEESAAAAVARAPATVAADIDKLIEKRLADAKIPVSPLTDDAEFIRRLSLDIRGRIPLPEKTAAFLASTDPNKRSKLIDEFLADSEYGEHFATIWFHRMIKPDDDNRGLLSDRLRDWLAESFNANRSWGRIVTDIMTAEGARDKNPQTVFWLANVGGAKNRQPEPNKITAAASRLFMGVRLECCECHNHPFATLKQTDFWSTAAFFTQTHADKSTKAQAKTGAVPSIQEGGAFRPKGGKNKDKTEPAPFGSIVIPDTKGKTVKAKFLLAEEATLPSKTVLRPAFAAWLTGPKNPYFARAAVNKMWANFFGRGIVSPIDDMRPESTNSHPELLDALAADFVASGHDLKHLIRSICNSKTYQRTSRPLPNNKEDEELFSHAQIRAMSADMLFDSLAVAMGHEPGDKVKGGGKGQKKKAQGGARGQFRKFFHAEADDDVGVVEDYTHGIPQVLRLMNSPQMNDTSAVVNRLTKGNAPPEKVIEGLYLTVLSRRPTETEMKRMKAYVGDAKDAAKGYGDVMWVLLNSSEFLFNH
jgi:hypothetical protein